MSNGKQENGRDANGRFLPGGPAGPGRPPRQTERAYLEALSEACPLDKWVQIVARAVEDAIGGDDKARGWLASYLIGRPIALQVDVTDAQGFNLLGLSNEGATELLRRLGRTILPEERSALLGEEDGEKRPGQTPLEEQVRQMHASRDRLLQEPE